MKNTKRITQLIAFLYIISFGVFGGLRVWAEESSTSTTQRASGFSYESLLPENQHSDASYFDLRMTPGQEQTVQIELRNPWKNPIDVAVNLSGAKTNSNGVIEYGPNELENDASLKYDFEKIVTGPEKVTIPAESSIMVDLAIKMPEAGFDGVIAGGIQLQEIEGEDAPREDGMVVNKYAYVIGMLLSETDTVIDPDMKLNKVYPELNNGRNAIFVNYSNIQPVYTDDMTTEVQIMKAGSEEVVYDTKKADMRMAPNSMFDFPVSLNGEAMVAGDYNAHILVTTKAGGRWEWDQKFTITDEEAEKFNSQDVGQIQERGINWLLIVLIAGGVFLLLLIIFLIVRIVNKKKEQKKQLQKRKKKNGRKKA
ncbi:DUF916 and DUF3324 domain-containing protein [Enterococcus sp. LJL128]